MTNFQTSHREKKNSLSLTTNVSPNALLILTLAYWFETDHIARFIIKENWLPKWINRKRVEKKKNNHGDDDESTQHSIFNIALNTFCPFKNVNENQKWKSPIAHNVDGKTKCKSVKCNLKIID